MLTYEKRGRNLLLTVEGVAEPFIIPPLPTNPALQATETYIGVTGGGTSAEDLAAALMMAVDGAVLNTDTNRWEPHPEAERVNYTRAGDELSQEEAENLLSAAFFWQTALGLSGVQQFIEAGEGTAGSFQAYVSLVGRVRRLNNRAPHHEPKED